MSTAEMSTAEMRTAAATADVVVVGGGIAGLVVAAEAAASGAQVVLLEAGTRCGGLLASTDIDGVVIDAGAESFATRTPAVSQLIADHSLALGSEALELVSPNPIGASLLCEDGRVRPLPRQTMIGLPAHPMAADVRAILGLGGALRAWAEPLVPKRASDAKLSLAELAERRFGAAVRHRLVEPIARSVYSTPARQLRLARVSPQLWSRYSAGGSLRAAVAEHGSATPAGSAVGGVRGGMHLLAQALRERCDELGVRVQTGATVVGLGTDTAAWHITGMAKTQGLHQEIPGAHTDLRLASERPGDDAGDQSRFELRASQLALAVPHATARGLLAQLGANHAGDVGAAGLSGSAGPSNLATAPDDVALCIVSVDSAALDQHPIGTGVIVAPGATMHAKALTHLNAKWAWIDEQLPRGRHLLRLSASNPAETGWMHDPAMLAAECSRLTGVRIQASHIRAQQLVRWPSAAAQPAEDGEVEQLLTAHPGLHLSGAWLAGTGLASVIPQARATASLLSHASRRTAPTPERMPQ